MRSVLFHHLVDFKLRNPIWKNRFLPRTFVYSPNNFIVISFWIWPINPFPLKFWSRELYIYIKEQQTKGNKTSALITNWWKAHENSNTHFSSLVSFPLMGLSKKLSCQSWALGQKEHATLLSLNSNSHAQAYPHEERKMGLDL